MSYDEPEYDLLAAFRARFGISDHTNYNDNQPPDTKVLSSAQQIYDEAVDVSISMAGTKAAARSIYVLMRQRSYSTRNWCSHQPHPDPAIMGEEEVVKFIFTTDLLNFSFWSNTATVFTVEYQGQLWTGYDSLVAALRRALDENIPITSSDFWQNEEECTDDVLRHVFRSTTTEEIPMFAERARCLRQAGQILYTHYRCSALELVRAAQSSARRLIHLLTAKGQPFAPLFADTAKFPPGSGQVVHFHKRAQILVADLWACFSGADDSPGSFADIDCVTMFPDYRIPQILSELGVLVYSPPLASRISRGLELESGGVWEIEIRGCSVWAVELIRKEIESLRHDNEVGESEREGTEDSLETEPGEGSKTSSAQPRAKVNAVLIDFFLYDLCQEQLKNGELNGAFPHHRTRSIWY